ncbi:MAG: DinB family protein [Sporocytophaga sp.]|uniref:DinB family protein n=1 Tax=Sporocytophaga sp. TaxID=2231183 RepID=UPI001B2F1481|nr:DinB family protein [Sporocytophaga sp.]MBO9699073.1 DinB family protein [Sporocytophaga sp.]
MKTVFEKSTRDELIQRINSLSQDSKANWGKMNIYQMLKHCVLWEEMVLQNKRYKRPFIGLLLGRFMLKNELKDRPMRRNNPTIPELMISETFGDFAQEKARWISHLNKYESYKYPDNSFIHPFFGKMTKEQIGYQAYKHSDHHLRQFGA